MYLLYNLHLVITKHLSVNIITSITQEKLNGKEFANVMSLSREHIIFRLGENNNTNCNGIEKAPIPMSEKHKMAKILSGLTLFFFRNNFVNKQPFAVTINIAVKTDNVISILRSKP